MTDCYYKVCQVLQSVTDCYYKVRQVLQSVTDFITNPFKDIVNSTNKVKL